MEDRQSNRQQTVKDRQMNRQANKYIDGQESWQTGELKGQNDSITHEVFFHGKHTYNPLATWLDLTVYWLSEEDTHMHNYTYTQTQLLFCQVKL